MKNLFPIRRTTCPGHYLGERNSSVNVSGILLQHNVCKDLSTSPSKCLTSFNLFISTGWSWWTNCSVSFMKSLGISYIIWLQSTIALSLCRKIRWCYCLLPEFMMMWFQNSFNLVSWLSTSSGEQGALTLRALVSSRVDPVWVLECSKTSVTEIKPFWLKVIGMFTSKLIQI